MESYVKIVGYRDYLDAKFKERTKQIYFEEPYNFPSHQDLFNNVETFLETNIPRAERYNLHYTINHVPNGAATKKEVAHIEVLPFDLDYIFTDRVEEYLRIVEEVFRVKRDSFMSAVTGNGLQCLFLLNKKLDESKYLSLKASYILKCDQIMERIVEKGLVNKISSTKETHCDLGILRVGTMRLPGTINSKKGKESKKAEFLTRTLSPVSLEQLGLYFEHIPSSKGPIKRQYLSVKSDYVFQECAALKDFKEREGRVPYAQWFNSISVVSRFTDVDGPRLVHDISKGHENYSYEETQKLIDYTISSGGPSGCAKFSESFKGCADCKYLKTKLKSPINLRDKSFFPNEHTGFHMQVESGKSYKWVPVYKELVGKFKQEYEHVSLQTSEDVYVYSQERNSWRLMPQREMLSILRKYTDAKPGDYPRTSVFSEALNHMVLENLVDDAEFYEASKGKVNFLNGHIEIRDEDLVFFENSVDSLRHRFLFSLPYEFERDAKCPTFNRFISEICNEDESKVLSLCEYIGYVISNDDYWAHKFMVLEGEGSNGKSVLLDVIRNLCGEGNYASLKVTDLANEQQRFNLIGKMANICDENEKGSLTKSADVKNLTAGGIFTFKQVYAKPGEARNRAKFIFSTNHGFSTTDLTEGMRRRYFPIPLDQTFKEASQVKHPNERVADPRMTDKLLEELPGIWNYCIKAYLEAKKRKAFTISKDTEESLEEFDEMSNPLKVYLDNFCGEMSSNPLYRDLNEISEVCKEAKHMEQVSDIEYLDYTYIPLNDLRKDFNAWIQDQGKTSNYGDKQFARMLNLELKKITYNKDIVKKIKTRKSMSKGKITCLMVKWNPFLS